jgi:hypothetical protein
LLSVDPNYPRATELPDETLPPAGAEGDFIIGPTHKAAPETTGTDDLLHRGKGACHRLLLAHDRSDYAVAATQQELDEVERLLETEGECPVIHAVHGHDQAGEDPVLRVAIVPFANGCHKT